MWLQDQIFAFVPSDETKQLPNELQKSTLIVDEKQTSTTLEQLFKGKPGIKSGNRLKGFSILQYINEKGEIEINSKIHKVSFIKDGVAFILAGYKNAQMQRSDKRLTKEDATLFGNLISGEVTKNTAPVEEAKVAATAESTPSKTEGSDSSPAVKVKDGDGAKFIPFNPANYNEDKSELIADGYIEYKPEVASNYSILIKGEDVKLVELQKDDYVVLDTEQFDIELDDKAHTFKIEKTSVPVV